MARGTRYLSLIKTLPKNCSLHYLILKEFKITVIELIAIATSAIAGCNNPAMARGITAPL